MNSLIYKFMFSDCQHIQKLCFVLLGETGRMHLSQISLICTVITMKLSLHVVIKKNSEKTFLISAVDFLLQL